MTMPVRSRRTRALLAASAVVLSSAAVVATSPQAQAADKVTSFCNSTVLPIQDFNPHSSTVTVSGITGSVQDVTVTLNNVSHGWIGDVIFSLDAPGTSVSLLNRLGVAERGGYGNSTSLNQANITFDDSAAPFDPYGSSFPSGSYGPVTPLNFTNAPASAVNGAWQLTVNDTEGGIEGSLDGGWCVNVIQAGAATSTLKLQRTAASAPGLPQSVSANLSSEDGTPSGTISYTIDGEPAGAPVPAKATTDGPDLSGLSVGTHKVTGVFTPSSPDYTSAQGSTTITVTKAGTLTDLTVATDKLSAAVSLDPDTDGTEAVAPLTGTVTFTVDSTEVGTVALDPDGTATLPRTTNLSGRVPVITATYNGDDNHTSSKDANRISQPTITAKATSAKPITKFGWYRKPVTVAFTCTPDGVALSQPCPAPQTLSTEGRTLSVSGVVTAADGGTDGVTQTVNLDRTKPIITSTGIENGSTYTTQPKPKCKATDALSGVKSCTTKVKKTDTGKKTDKYRYTTKATDAAGNTTTTTGTYRVIK